MSIDLRQPFLGSLAVATGLLTPGELRGPRFRRLFTGVYVAADVEVTFALRSRAAHLLVAGCGVLGGYSAAELLGASCGPFEAPAEVVVSGGHRPRQGLVVRRDVLEPDEITLAGGLPVTTALRTAFDLARRGPLVDAVVAVDALAYNGRFDPADLVPFAARHLGARGSRRLPDVVRLASRLAASPMETRIRLALRNGGLPAPVLQHPVGPYLLDLAYPHALLGVEHNGRDHLDPDRALRDLEREACLAAAGWKILRFRAFEIMRRPWSLAATVGAELAARAGSGAA
ncbi:DUF559 domain-containing protein [Pseudonocardia nigra]|uniref:DUF559 domain-containing protein n=1 Tax=Pseudonocardia nigra TaxID=1921578 RepID=UPI001C5FD359|nr:DUF559 domain-containing protein [Pseudonocardia nigra]